MPVRLGNYLPVWDPKWKLPAWQKRGFPSRARQWADKLPYKVKQALVYTIDLQPGELRQGSRWQIEPKGGVPPWLSALKRQLGRPAATPAMVRELWHARGQVRGDDLEGLVGVLPLGGAAVLRAAGCEVP